MLNHGTRRTYQREHCRCTLCRAAEATYRSNLRLRKAKGQPILGMLVSAVEARRRVRQMKREGYPETRIAAMAGWRDRRARHVQLSKSIRVSTLQKIQRVAVFAMLEGASPVETFEINSNV